VTVEDEDWIKRKVVNVLFKKRFENDKEVDLFIDDLNLYERGLLNKEKLFYNGIGSHFFSFNEQDNKGIVLNNKTLYDYDKNNFFEQAKIIDEYNGVFDKSKHDYKNLKLFHDWCRLFVDSKLVYGVLDSLGVYVYSILETFLDEKVDEIYPYEFVDGDDHGKEVEGGFLWDMKIDANGKEKQLDELKTKVYNDFFYKGFYDDVVDYCESLKLNTVFVKRDKDEDGISDFFVFVFSDKEIAKKIKFNNFYNDVTQNESNDWEKVNAIIDKYKEILSNKVSEVYKEVESNHQENVLQFKPKNKSIVVTESMMKSLNDLGKDDE
jgi:hypothetical protein